MRRITDIKEQEKRRTRLNVYLDGEYGLSLSTALLAAYGYKIGDLLTTEQVEELRAADARQAIYDAALQFLSFRPRSVAEVRRRLLQHRYDPALIEEALGRLGELDLLDDAAFAAYWKENRDLHSPRGERLLRAELRQKGVDGDTIAETLEGRDEEEGAYRAGLSRARRLRDLDFLTFRRKLGDFLVRRGFGYDVVKTVVNRLWQELREAPVPDDEEYP